MEKDKPVKKIKIRNIIYLTVISLLIISVAFVFITKAQNKPLFIFGKSCVWIVSPSMKGIFDAQSFILVEEVTADQVQRGDIIMFYSSDPAIKGQLNTHMVQEIIGKNEEFVTKGYANVAEDAYKVGRSDIVARYVTNLPVLTLIMHFFLSKVGFMCFIAFILIITIIAFYSEMKKRNLTKKSETDTSEEEMKRLIAEEVERLKEQHFNENNNNNDNA